MARVRRRKLDVRYDEVDVVAAEAAAVATGVRLADVMRAAAKIGLKSSALAAALRAESTAGEGVRVARAAAVEVDQARLLSGVEGMMRGAGAGAAAAPRPAAAPSALRASATPIKLEVVIARRIAAHNRGRGAAATATDLATARRGIARGMALVDGRPVVDPGTLVDPATVTPARS